MAVVSNGGILKMVVLMTIQDDDVKVSVKVFTPSEIRGSKLSVARARRA